MDIKEVLLDEEVKAPKWTKWDQFTYWLYKNGGWRITSFINSIKNLIRWFPIIWKDRDHDDYYIFEVLKFKIKNTMKLHIQNQRYVGWERQVEYMKTCIKLITYIQDEHYADVAHDNIHAKYGESKIVFKPLPDTTYSSMDIVYDKVDESNQEEADAYMLAQYKLGSLKQDKARRLLFRILEEKIEYWWD